MHSPERRLEREMVSEADLESYAQKLYEAKQEGKDKEFLESLKNVLTEEELREVERRAKIIEEREAVFARLEKLKETLAKAKEKKKEEIEKEKPKEEEEVEFVTAEIKPEKAEAKAEKAKEEEKEGEVKFVSAFEKEEEEELLPGELPGMEEVLPSEEETEKELELFEEKKLGLEAVAGEKPLAARELTPAQEQAMATELILSALDRGFTPEECIDMLLEAGFSKDQTFIIMKLALKRRKISYS